MPDSLCSRSSEFLSLSCSCSRQSTSEILPSSEAMEVEEGQRVRQWKGGRWRGRKEERNGGSRGKDVESEGGGGGEREKKKKKQKRL